MHFMHFYHMWNRRDPANVRTCSQRQTQLRRLEIHPSYRWSTAGNSANWQLPKINRLHFILCYQHIANAKQYIYCFIKYETKTRRSHSTISKSQVWQLLNYGQNFLHSLSRQEQRCRQESFKEGWSSKTDIWKSCCFTNILLSSQVLWVVYGRCPDNRQEVHGEYQGYTGLQKDLRASQGSNLKGLHKLFHWYPQSQTLGNESPAEQLELSSPVIMLMLHSSSIYSVKKLLHSNSPSPWHRAPCNWRIAAEATKRPHHNSLAQQ